MFQGNENLRKEGEKIEYDQDMINDFIKCQEDILYFAATKFFLVHPDRGKIKVDLYDWQKKVLKACVETPGGRRHLIGRVARQSGKTSVITIYLLWYALFNKDKTVVIIAHKQEAAIDILRRVKTAYEMLPVWLQQGVVEGGWNKQSIILENGSRILAKPTSGESVTSLTVNVLFLDEFAKVPNHIAEQFITSTYPVITAGKSTKIIMMSTPLGMNHYYEFWQRACRSDEASNFFPIKVGWWEVPGRDKEWRDNVIKDIGKLRWSQEYACNFLGSQSTLIDSDVLEQIVPKDPVAMKWTGLLKVYEQPVPNGKYVCGVDTGKGVQRDSSVIQVLRIDDIYNVKQAAIYRNDQIIPHDFAQICVSVAKYYNNAWLMVENNDIGHAVADAIFYEYEYEFLVNEDPKGLGVRSTKKTKPIANMLLKEYLEKERLSLYDERTIFELSRYEEIRPNVFAAGKHEHDDTVTALLWAIYFLRTDTFEGKDTDIKSIDEEYELNGNDEDWEFPTIIFD